MKAKKKACAAATAVQGVLRITDSGNGKHLAVVVDVGQHLNRSRKFSDEDFADAAWFATSTDAVSAFKEFLLRDETGDGSKLSSSGRVSDCGDRLRSFVCLRQNRWTGLRYAVVMVRLANGQLRAMSFHDRRLSKPHRDRSRNVGDDELVKRAVTFSRSAAFREWREQVSIEAPPSSKSEPGAAQHGERSLKHPHAFVGYDKGEKVDCRCGKNRNRGQMVACELCGTREHLECLDYSQIPANHICTACVRAQKEEVIVINMDEQEEGRLLSSGDSWTDSKARDRGGNESVCCICGCEDNEEYETMIQPCTCDGAPLAAHPSCVALAMESLTAKDRNKQSGVSGTCHACGRQVTNAGSPKPATLKRSTRRTDNSSKGVKRLRSALVHPGKSDTDDNNLAGKEGVSPQEKTEERKSEVGVLGRRFSEAASTVPIKKRRIQIMDSIRSPSPPSRSRSPSPLKPNSLDVDEYRDSRYGKGNGLDSERVHGKEVYDERLPKCTQNKVEEEEEPVIHDYDMSKDEDFERTDLAENEAANNDKSIKQVDGDNSHSSRSHWDLNMYMDAWERPCDDIPGAANSVQQLAVGAEQVEQSVITSSTEANMKAANMKAASMEAASIEAASMEADITVMKDQATEEIKETEELVPTDETTLCTKEDDKTVDHTEATNESSAVDVQVSDGKENVDLLVDGDPSPSDADPPETEGLGKDDKPPNKAPEEKASAEAEYKEVFTEYDTFEEEDEPEPDPIEKAASAKEGEKVEEGQISTDDWAGDAAEEIEAENVDYGDSDEGEDAADVTDEKFLQPEVDYEGEQGEIHEYNSKQESESEASRKDGAGYEEPEAKHIDNAEEANEDLKSQKKGNSTGRIKSSGWDQLPEGFETAEDALRASKELFRRGVKTGGWSGTRIRMPVASRFESGYDRFRHDDGAWSRHDHHDQRNDMYETDARFYSRDFGRGRSRGGPSSPLVPRRGELWMNGSVPQGQWGGPKHHLSPPGRFAEGVGFHGQANAAAVAAAKVESSGFVVAPDGTITKAGSPGAAVRAGGRPFPGGRNPPLMLNPNRAPEAGMPEAMGPGRGIGLSPGLRVGPGMGMGTVSTGLRSSRGMIDRHPYGHGLDSPVARTASGRGGYLGDHPDKWDRRELSPSSFKGRRSPNHRRSRSRSRSGSPRKSIARHSRSPGYVKGKEVSPNSIPPPPKLPLPPPPPRGQRSPPAGLKRLSDRREGERRFFEQDYPPVEREPRTSGWDLGPGEVGEMRRIGASRFDDIDRHDRRLGGRDDSRRDGRRDKAAISSSRQIVGSRDGEDEVAPRRRRPPS